MHISIRTLNLILANICVLSSNILHFFFAKYFFFQVDYPLTDYQWLTSAEEEEGSLNTGTNSIINLFEGEPGEPGLV